MKSLARIKYAFAGNQGQSVMPKAIKIISVVNLLLAVLFMLNLLFMEKVELSYPFANYINLITSGAFIVVSLIALFRFGRMIGFARALIYVVMLVLGLQILLTFKYLFSFYGLVTIIIDALVIFYLVGVRGYLASERAANYFTG